MAKETGTGSSSKSDSSALKPNSSASKSKGSDSKSESPDSKSDNNTNTTAGPGDQTSDSSGSSKTSGAPSRPISYFSSVSTDEYRTGWNDIFGYTKGQAKTRSSFSKKHRVDRTLPLVIDITAEQLPSDTKKEIEKIIRKELRKNRLNYDNLSKNGQVNLRISCHISSS